MEPFEPPSPLSEMPIYLLETNSSASWRLKRQLRGIENDCRSRHDGSL